MNFVAVDLGASETRFTSNKSKGEVSTVSNAIRFVERIDGDKKVVDLDPVKIEDIGEGIYKALELIIHKDSASTMFPMHVLAENMAVRYSNSLEVPNSNIPKRRQRINYFSLILACTIARINDGVDEDIDLYMMLPPGEVNDTSRDAFNSELLGHFTVELPKYNGGTTVKLNIKSITIKGESAMALTSFLYHKNLKPRVENAQYTNGLIMSLDIGASTTDIIIRNVDNTFIDASIVSIRRGGSEIAAFIRKRLTSEIGSFPDKIVDTVIREGRLPSGAGYDVETGKKILNEAKQDVARNIYNDMNKSLPGNYPLVSIGAVVVSGGGNMQSQYIDADGEPVKTTEPLSKFIELEIKSESPGTAVVSVGSNPRMANIDGLYTTALAYEYDKALKAAQNAAETPQN